MAKVCDVCGRKPQFGHSVSHAHNVSKRRFNPNLRPVRVTDDKGRNHRSLVCTRCLRSGKVQKRVS